MRIASLLEVAVDKGLRDKLLEVADESAPEPGEEAAMSGLTRVVEELNSTLELDQVLERVAERIRSLVDYDALGILLLDPLGQELRPRLGVGLPKEVMEHWRFGLGQGIVGTAAQTLRPVLVSEVGSDPRYIGAVGDVRSELAVPLVARSRPIGVLDVQSRRPGYYNERHQRLLTFLAGHVANAIENAQLYENLREQARTLSLMHEVGRELTSILDRDQLLKRIAEMVKRLINYQLFSVMLWDEEKRLLDQVFSLRYDERFVQKTGVPLGYGICGTVAALRQSLRVPNVYLDPRYARCGHGVEVRSELTVPLVFKDRLIGVLDLESVEYNAFTEHHEQTLSTLAAHVATALENARLYEKLRHEEKRLAEDLSTAREVQKRLLPDVPPCVPGLDIGFAYAPARHLGGDFYDFLPYGDGRLAIAVGDVAGKATAAALHGSLAIGILRGYAMDHSSEPDGILERINGHLIRPGLDNRFVAMAFGVFDTRDRSLVIANAGFTRPHLVRNGQVEEVPVEGLPLGLIPDARYQQTRLTLEEGDVLVFCSDGLHECLDKEGEEFGNKRVKALLKKSASEPAGEIASRLLHSTDRHAEGNGEASDDRTVVVLKVTALTRT